jgi:hypothetical protein
MVLRFGREKEASEKQNNNRGARGSGRADNQSIIVV